jgi:hypothetical protein
MDKANRAAVLHGLRDGGDDGFCVLAPQIINDNVDAMTELCDQRLFGLFRASRISNAQAERDQDIGPQSAQLIEFFGVAPCADDPAC